MLNQKYCNKCSGWVKNSHIHFLDGQQKIFTGPKRKFCADCKIQISLNAKRCVPCSQVARQRPKRRQCLSCKKIFQGVPSDKNYYGFCSEDCKRNGKTYIECTKCGNETTLDKRTCEYCVSRKICRICNTEFYKFLTPKKIRLCSVSCFLRAKLCHRCGNKLNSKHLLCATCDMKELKTLIESDRYFYCSKCFLKKMNTQKYKLDICIDCK